jgi:hypothetical protein
MRRCLSAPTLNPGVPALAVTPAGFVYSTSCSQSGWLLIDESAPGDIEPVRPSREGMLVALEITAVSLGSVLALPKPALLYMRGYGDTQDIPLIIVRDPGRGADHSWTPAPIQNGRGRCTAADAAGGP